MKPVLLVGKGPHGYKETLAKVRNPFGINDKDSRFHETDQNISMDTDLLGDSGEKRLPIVF